MFKEKLREIIKTIESQNQLFEGKGFVKDLKTAGGFDGFTDEYKNYFFGYIVGEEDEDKYRTSKEEGQCGVVNVEFEFKLLFDINGCHSHFIEIIMAQLYEITGIREVQATDESEAIYLKETRKELKTDNCDIYSFTCKYENKEYLDFSCLDFDSIKIENCKPIR